jgi:hypothetical protein
MLLPGKTVAHDSSTFVKDLSKRCKKGFKKRSSQFPELAANGESLLMHCYNPHSVPPI